MKKQVFATVVLMFAAFGYFTPAGGADVQKGGNLLYGSVTEVASLDPHVYQGTSWKTITLCLYNSLFSFNEKGEPVASLSEKWETPDGRTVILHLRKGIKFHKGQAFTARDVNYSFQRILDPANGATFRSSLQGTKITIIDDYTIKIEKEQPDVTILNDLAMIEMCIVSEEWMKTSPNIKLEANGTGPFMLVENEPKVRVVVKRNPVYFEKELPHLDQIEFRMIKDGEARVNALKTGAVDMIDTVPWKDIDILKKTKGIKVDVSDGEFMNLWLNTSKKPLDDPRVRRAIAYGINREAVSEAAFFGYGSPLYGLPTVSSAWYYNKDLANTFSHDPAKAKQLLVEAGYGKGFDLELLTYQGLTIYTTTAQIIQANLKEIGINVNIQLAEWANVVERKNKGQYDFLIYGVTIKGPDPDAYSYYFGSESGYWAKPIGFTDERMEELLKKGRSTLNMEERKRIYYELEKRVMELSPWVFINWRAKAQAYKDKVHGYIHTGGGLAENFPGVKTVWIAR